jgi:SpoVK/Ycf46/Vps4 family AAA+-type ATPase
MEIIKNYKHRIVESYISSLLKISGGILLVGPKWCGKTETAKIFAKSMIKLDDPAGNFSNRKLAALDPALALQGDKPRLVDEWQVEPKL